MKPSIAASFLLLVGTSSVAAIKETMVIEENGVTFNVRWWDDGRSVPYEIFFEEAGLEAYHTFSADGRLYQLQIGWTTLTFTWGSLNGDEGSPKLQSVDSSDRMLVGQDEEDEVDDLDAAAILDHRRLYACHDCENTFETLCGQGLDDVCYWVPILPSWTSDYQAFAMQTVCTEFGEACKTSPEAACEGYCGDGSTPAPVSVSVPTPEPASGPTPAPVLAPTSESGSTPAPVSVSVPTPEPASGPTPAPVLAPTSESGVCNPNLCQNGGSCAEYNGGGHVCTCASGYGGMACQTDTSSLSVFYIEIDYIGTWTQARKNVFQSAADRWSEVITHIPCGGSQAGPLVISATLEEIDGPSGILGFAGPSYIWTNCPGISTVGGMSFDIDDISSMENDGTFEAVILHEMGHVIGIGTLWGPGFGGCETCRRTGSAIWTCPATLEAYADLGGTGSNIIELDGEEGTSCSHFDEVIFTDELMTGYVDNEMLLSKMTAASLDDIGYIVNPSKVDPYTLPSERTGSTDEAPIYNIVDVAVETTIVLVDDDGTFMGERAGIMMQF